MSRKPITVILCALMLSGCASIKQNNKTNKTAHYDSLYAQRKILDAEYISLIHGEMDLKGMYE